MFRIRQILDASAPANSHIIIQVQDLLKQQFSAVKDEEINTLSQKLNNPLKYRFQSRLFVAEKSHRPILGFAWMLYVSDLNFCILDYIASGSSKSGQGIGEALYARVQKECLALGANALLYECLPDDPKLSPDPKIRKQNEKRLAFYERFGAFPIMGTRYETPVKEGDSDPPYLLIDRLGQKMPTDKMFQRYVQSFLERKYGDLCSPDYIKKVVSSFKAENIHLRKARYYKKDRPALNDLKFDKKLFLIANENHNIHDVPDQGYVESPVRIQSILKEMEKLSFVEKVNPQHFSDKHITAVHDTDYVSFLKKSCMRISKGKSVYPYVFPIRNQSRKPIDTALLAGYYCIDTFTPLNSSAYLAARSAVDCALSAADIVLDGHSISYALVRPPGHHAEKKSFGGFCYFANTAIAAHYLSNYGKVAILDIDYHHGNSQQNIFYERSDVLTISLHGDPKIAYPYFTGFKDETGALEGKGYNINIPLPEKLRRDEYLLQLKKTLKIIDSFNPAFLLIALGLDTAKSDPTGTWSLLAEDFEKCGALIGAKGYPTAVIQEGGYRTQTLGINAKNFFKGFYKAHQMAKIKPTLQKQTKKSSSKQPKEIFRTHVHLGDIEAIKTVTAATQVFSQEEILTAGELVSESIHHGDKKSGYSFIIYEQDNKVLAYTCYGQIALTQASYDLYWIVVHPCVQGKGIAQKILQKTWDDVKARGGTSLHAETSSLPTYKAARKFYKRFGFKQIGEYQDFYKPGDAKVTFMIKCT
ncbi:MAG TPA: GNAT family N-acetyltransferase [Oligoflexia bacterium]|nr:GNAT family N-acetyltransferase [Oligoflexia bacterium]HMR24294.1 GNAT family N-acetyltransferase [Oligoflexia bacterium]